MNARHENGTPRERILETVMDLFYRQGYGATGVNQIIEEAGVAKASFYDHFKSKEDLLVAYAAETSRREIAEMRNYVQKIRTPLGRFFGPIDMLPPWFSSSDFRGCPFQNLLAEVGHDLTGAHQVAKKHREASLAFFKELALDLKLSGPKYSHIDTDGIAADYLVIFEGAIAASVAYRDLWPVTQAKEVVKRLLASTS